MEVYKHGGDIYGAMRQLKVPMGSIIDFSANINPLIDSQWLLDKITPYIERVLHYPDPGNTELRQAISKKHGVAEAGIVLGNGATPLIHALVATYQPHVAYLSGPTFGEYGVALRKQGVMPQIIPVCPETFGISLPQFEAMPWQDEQASIIFICNPNNPTGDLVAPKKIESLLKKLPPECLLVVDEAFIDFTEEGESNSVVPLLEDYANLVVLRSATKFYGMPGLRLGYALCGSLELAGNIIKTLPIWQVNVLAEAVFIEASKDADFERATRDQIKGLRVYFQNALIERGYRVWPSTVNYFLIKN